MAYVQLVRPALLNLATTLHLATYRIVVAFYAAMPDLLASDLGSQVLLLLLRVCAMLPAQGHACRELPCQMRKAPMMMRKEQSAARATHADGRGCVGASRRGAGSSGAMRRLVIGKTFACLACSPSLPSTPLFSLPALFTTRTAPSENARSQKSAWRCTTPAAQSRKASGAEA